MNRFGVFSPLVLREDMPSILMSQAYSPDSRNVRMVDGYMSRVKMRKSEMVRSDYETVIIENFVSTGDVYISGDHTAEFLSGDTVAFLTPSLTSGIITAVSGSFILSGPSVTTGTTYTRIPCTTLLTGVTTGDYVYSTKGGVTSNRKIPVPDGNPILRYHTLTQQTAGVIIENLFAFTKNHAYRFNVQANNWQTVHTCSGDCTAWSTQAMNNKLIATNFLDVPLVWAANETPFAPLNGTVVTTTGTVTVATGTTAVVGSGTTFSGTNKVLAGDYILFAGHQRPYRVAATVSGDTLLQITEAIETPINSGATFTIYCGTKGPNLGSSYWIRKAAHVRAFEGHLFFGKVVTRDAAGDLGYYLGGIIWSDLGNEAGFDISGAGDAGSWNASEDKTTYYLPGSDYVSGFGEAEGTLLIFKEGSIHSLWSVATDLIWNTDQISEFIGTKAPDSIVKDPDQRLFFLASDMSIREIRGSRVSDPVRRTARDIVPSLIPNVRATYIRELKEIWWAVASPLDGVTPSANNTVLSYDTENGIWYKYILPIEAFGQYSRQSAYTWDTLPYATWNEWAGTWDGAESVVDWPVDLGANTVGNTFELHGSESDDGSDYEARMVITTDLANKQALSYFKRMQGIEVICKRGNLADVVTVSVKADGGAFDEIGSLSLYDATDPDYIRVRLPMDKRGRVFEVKLSALCPLDWYGAIFEYVPAGER